MNRTSKQRAVHGTSVAPLPDRACDTSPWSAFPFTTVLFDVDGTLVEKSGSHAETWDQALREHAIDATLARVRSLVGMGTDNLQPALAQIGDESDLGRSIARRDKKKLRGVSPIITLSALRCRGLETCGRIGRLGTCKCFSTLWPRAR
jgi:hypothetical protein